MKTERYISIVIPAANEAAVIERAIRSIQAQQYPNHEVIVVVNGSTDDTARIAEGLGARVLVFKEMLGSSQARNEGAALAKGEVIVFLDADSYMGKGVLSSLSVEATEGVFGTVIGAPDNTAVSYRIFFAWKNLIHRFNLFRGVLGGLLFFDAKLFRHIRGFDDRLMVNEFADLIRRASSAGGRYMYLRSCVAYTSMRRFEEQGFLRPLFFWAFVQVFWRSAKKRALLGAAYAASHNRLFEVEPKELGASIISLVVGGAGIALGALVLFASYYGPAALILDIFSEQLAKDPSTPIIDTMLYVAATSRLQALLLFGACVLIVSTVIFVRNVRDFKQLLREELSY